MTTLQKLIEKIEECQFECEAGNLTGLKQWQELKQAISELPEFGLHQWVNMTINGEVQGIPVSSETKLCIQAIRMESDTEKTFPVYGLTDDPCGPYHYGKPVKFWAKGNALRIPNEKLTDGADKNV